MKLTPWFPRTVKPVRQGFYETNTDKDDPFPLIARWTGSQWEFRSGVKCVCQAPYWRGLTERAK